MHKTSYEGEAAVLLVMMRYFLGVVATLAVLVAEELENLIGHISKQEWLLANLGVIAYLCPALTSNL